MRRNNSLLALPALLAGLLVPTPDLRDILPAFSDLTTADALIQMPWTHPLFSAFLGLALLGLAAAWGWRVLAARKLSAGAKTAPAPKPPAIRMDRLDREFLPAALELFQTPPSPIRVAGIWLICLVFATALAWSYFGWLDIYAIAPGRIQPNGRSKIVQPLEAGKVIAIAVENGSHVTAGDLLIELDARETGADHDAQRRDHESALAEAARRRVAIRSARGELPAGPMVPYPPGVGEDIRAREAGVLAADLAQLFSGRASLLAQRAERAATRDRLTASLAERDKLLALYKEHADMLQTLQATKTASRAQVIDTLQQYQTLATTQVGDKGQLAEAEASLATLDRRLEETTFQFVADQTQKLAEAERQADRLQQELVKAATRHERTRLTAPISGTIQELAVTTVGQVVAPGQALMTVVPLDAPIEIAAMIQNQDIGFVQAGQPAVIKIESFPFTRFGTIDGTVLKVSRDAVDEREATSLDDPKSTIKLQGSTASTGPTPGQNLVFPATVSLARRFITVDGKEIPLSPGMAVTVEISTGKRRALDYVLSPLREVTSGAAHER